MVAHVASANRMTCHAALFSQSMKRIQPVGVIGSHTGGLYPSSHRQLEDSESVSLR